MNITEATTWSGLGFVLVLLLRGFLVLSEFSLVNLRYSEVDKEALAHLRKRKRIAYLLDNLKRAGETIRLGRKFCSLATGGFLFLLIFGLFEHKHASVAMVLAVVLGVLAQVLVSDLIPRFLAGKNPQKALQHGVWAVLLFWIVGWPFLKIQVDS